MAAKIYVEKLAEPDVRMLAYDLAETRYYPDEIVQFIGSESGD